MYRYLDLLEDIFINGEVRGDRTGTGTFSLFGKHLEIPLGNGFPLLTTKKMFWKGIVHELLWFFRGEDNIKYLTDNDVHIWDEWADDDGGVGPIYGVQWRNWWCPDNGNHVDQLQEAIDKIKNKPEDRRIIVSAWNVNDIPGMGLPPCHVMFQFYVHVSGPKEGQLDCHMYQRSADMFLGVPFNIASYALLVYIIAKMTDLTPGTLTISFGDVHIYQNHFLQVREQLTRDTKNLPHLEVMKKHDNINDYVFDDFALSYYDPLPAISAPIAV